MNYAELTPQEKDILIKILHKIIDTSDDQIECDKAWALLKEFS